MSDPNLSTTRQARRERILQAAEQVFRTDGFRGASMERIAEKVGMSKVTLYGYFKDKEAVFEGVARRFAEQIRLAFEAALKIDGSLADKISNALISKHTAVSYTVRGSTSPQELFAARDQLASQIFQELDLLLIDQICAVLANSENAMPNRLANLLFTASLGIANAARTNADMEADVRLLVTSLLTK